MGIWLLRQLLVAIQIWLLTQVNGMSVVHAFTSPLQFMYRQTQKASRIVAEARDKSNYRKPLTPMMKSDLSVATSFLKATGQEESETEKKSKTNHHKKTTLTEETNWTLRFVLRGIPTEQGKRIDEIFSIEAQFIEDVGYEPPQGELHQIVKVGDGDDDVRFKIAKGRWILSEDPNDRKDGLWVWGLFKEPLYPFLLLNIETDAIPLPGNTNKLNEDDFDRAAMDYIKPLRLYAQINHKREKDDGGESYVVLDSSNELKLRKFETMKVDPFGAASADISEDIPIGTLSIQPKQ